MISKSIRWFFTQKTLQNWMYQKHYFQLFFSFSETQQKGHGMGNLLSKIVLGTTGGRPDFNVEEKVSIEKDSRELKQIVREMADYLPREDPEKGEEVDDSVANSTIAIFEQKNTSRRVGNTDKCGMRSLKFFRVWL